MSRIKLHIEELCFNIFSRLDGNILVQEMEVKMSYYALNLYIFLC